MSYVELPILFSCGSESLMGILSKSESAGHVGVLIVVGGPQYRVGSHRQFVLLARSLAAAGLSVFRFDYRGMGASKAAGQAGASMRDWVREDLSGALAAARRVHGHLGVWFDANNQREYQLCIIKMI